MRNLRIPGTGTLALTLLLVSAAPVSSQQVDPNRGPDGNPADGIEAVLEHRAAEVEADRSAILDFLDGEEVQRVAEERGIDLEGVRNAVQTLHQDDVRDLAQDLQAVGDDMAGGDRIVIASSTIIIILLILILIAVS